MPILHNYKTKGLQWQKLGVTAEMVLERNKEIGEGSAILWDYVQNIVREAVEKGFLQEREKRRRNLGIDNLLNYMKCSKRKEEQVGRYKNKRF